MPRTPDEASIDTYLSSIYYLPKQAASFTDPYKLWHHIRSRPDRPEGIKYKQVKEWMNVQPTHNIHKYPKTRFEREPIIVESIDEQWDADLIVITDLAKFNDGYSYILVLIDLFSRFCWARVIKKKTGVEVVHAFQSVFKEGRKCQSLRTDRGTEFTNKHFQDYIQTQKVHHLKTYSETKASYAERMNLTLQRKLYKYFYEKQTYRYIDVLQDIVDSYNATIHNTIGMSPKDVNRSNSLSLYIKVYLPLLDKRPLKHPAYLFSIGDTVRISYERHRFARSYQEHFTEELFTVTRRIPSHPPRYKLTDLAGEDIKGSFYAEQLQKAVAGEDTVYKIQKVLGYKTIGGKRKALVQWYGYPAKFNSYINATELKNYSGK